MALILSCIILCCSDHAMGSLSDGDAKVESARVGFSRILG